MFSRIQEKLGTAGLIVAIVALVAALGGTAFAAAGLTGKEKKEVKKIAKQLAGKRGPAGPAGSAGATGPTGANGKDGANGSNGASGTPGKSVTLAAAGSSCASGGVAVEVEGTPASKQVVCDGTDGEDGACSAGNTTCVLPTNATLTGLWSFTNRGRATIESEVGGTVNTYVTGISGQLVTISFPLRVLPAPAFVWVGPGEATPGVGNCPGTPSAPEAEPGFLCVYGVEVEHAGEPGTHEPIGAPAYSVDATSGLTVEFQLEAGKEGYGYGSWAVTAAPPPAP